MGWKCGGCGDRGPEHNAIWCPSCGQKTPTPTDDTWGFTAADWLGQGTPEGDAMYERARKIVRFRRIDSEIWLVFRGDDVIGRVFDIDHRGGAGFDLKFDHHPTVYGLDDWDQVEFIVKSVTATDPHFA